MSALLVDSYVLLKEPEPNALNEIDSTARALNGLGNINCANNERLKNEYLKAVCNSNISLSARCAQAVGVCLRNLPNRKDPCVKSICNEACSKCGCD